MTWTRKNVWDLIDTPGNSTLHWYARGVAIMQQRPIADPTSWLFQAAVHGSPGWPDAPPEGSPWAGVAQDVRKAFWDQCQHQTWFFLPWHRIYLGYFERIVRAAIVADGGPEDWALPYWNYSKSLEQRTLPPPFREPTLADGSDNPLFVAARDPAANAGEQFMDDADVALDALRVADFSAGVGETGASFAGPATPFQHFGSSSGALESVPHNQIHVEVGRPDGWMIDPNRAALDPIFWLHHANIDRLWEVWLASGRANTDDAAWASEVFDFMDEQKVHQRVKPVEVSSSVASPFDYTYDDLTNPFPVPVTAGAVARVTMAKPKAALAAATSRPTPLTQQRVDVMVPRPATARAPAATPKKVYLSLEGITADKPAVSYDIYVGVDAQHAPGQEQFVARLAPFGIAAASHPKGPHRGAGLSETFDISDVIARLRAKGVATDTGYKVTIVPVKGANDAAVKVARIAVYEA